MTVLYILYWLENTDYLANEITIASLIELTLDGTDSNYQPLFYKYIDQNILTNKNYKIN